MPETYAQLLLLMLTIIAPVVSTFAIRAFNSWADKAGMAADDSRRAVVERAIENGLAMAEQMASNRMGRRPTSALEFAGDAAAYVTKTAGKSLRDLGVSDEALDKAIMARAAKKLQQVAPTAVVEVKS